MKLRAPAYPLLNVDPYYSVWSASNKLTDSTTVHWTNHPNTIRGLATIDGQTYRFIGQGDEPALEQISVDVDAMSTTYRFACGKVILTAVFTSPRLADDLYWLSSPVAFVELSAKASDGSAHDVSVKLSFSEEFCLNEKGQYAVDVEKVDLPLPCIRMGSAEQKVLNRSGDDVRIDWGYFYLAARGCKACVDSEAVEGDMTYITACADISGEKAVLTCAYDDICSIQYFGANLKSWWNKDGETILTAIEKADSSYECLCARCKAFSDSLFADAVKAGGEQYAELLSLAWRQVMAAHKVAVDENGEVLFISKECFSNGCAATVDVSYPSIPMFLLYNPELVKGMMRPIFRYAESDMWPFDFAPHDCGQYPLVNGQVYGDNKLEFQMPVEECGNMLGMVCTTCIADGDTAFVEAHLDTLEHWTKYLIQYGVDPENQLCTDDFAGHLAHNCNLAIKAIMGVASYALLLEKLGRTAQAEEYMAKAKEMASIWVKTASNGDGSYRLAFDRPGTFSMKYNAVWDKLYGTGVFPAEMILSEVTTNVRRFNQYGMPLDNRADYTKSDWLVWTATMTDSREDFERWIAPLWQAYNDSESRVPMTDWYFTSTAKMRGFRHRTVQGGLFIKLLDASGKMKVR